MSADITTDLYCDACRAITAHVYIHGAQYPYRCTTETEDRTCGKPRTYDATTEDAYGVGPLSEAWAGRDEADAAALVCPCQSRSQWYVDHCEHAP